MPNAALVQCTATPTAKSGALGTVWHVFFPSPTLAGNAIIVFAGAGIDAPTTTLSITDDLGSTYTAGATATDVGNTYKGASFYLLNNPGGIRRIDFTFTGTGGDFVQFYAEEVRNIATSSAADGSAGQASAGTSWTSGAFPTTVDGDYIIQWARNTATSSLGPGITTVHDAALSGGKVRSIDSLESGMCVQAGTQTTHGSINPALAMSGIASTSYISITLAFKTASAGTAPDATLPHIIRTIGQNVSAAGLSSTFQFPCEGTSLVAAWVGANGSTPDPVLNAATDSQGNQWSFTQPPAATASAGCPNFGYAQRTTPSDVVSITFSITAGGNASTIVMYDVENMDGYDVSYASAIGITSGTTLTTVSIAAIERSLIFACVGVEGGTCRELQGSNYYSDNNWWLEEDPTLQQFYENNGWGHRATTVPGTYTFTWTTTSDPTHWAASALAFQPHQTISDYSLFPKQIISDRPQGLS